MVGDSLTVGESDTVTSSVTEPDGEIVKERVGDLPETVSVVVSDLLSDGSGDCDAEDDGVTLG